MSEKENDIKVNASDSNYRVGNGSKIQLLQRSCNPHTDKLNAYDWLADLPDNADADEMVEVQFKPPRKGYYLNSNHLDLHKGDVVAVEANPGHDIGTVTMTGRLVALQMKKANLKPNVEFKRIYRKARTVDIDKYKESKAHEHDTMIESRQIAKDLGLQMKIGDVEYQGDGNKAIFYYIADERVDFRQLIKVLAERFRVRIEMKQIGARQEAGRIGGIGPCGRELCCATWMTSFVSVSTSAARFQDISLNPQKLAGQCAKLKCCLNYEVDQYVESLKRLPSREITLHTTDNEYYFFKADILAHMITYSTDKHILANERTISARRAFEVIEMNRNGQKPNDLNDTGTPVVVESKDLLDQENITRFDRAKKKKKKGGNTPASDPQPPAKQSGERRQQSEDRRQQKIAHKAQNMSQEAKKPQNKPRGNRHKPNNVRNSTNGQ
ncbi:MAG: hypothetical protein IJ607_06825 [Bacteroidaceae bacterium]|nr:hypothetical protein [Bacteroidaceae bacterium]